MKTKSVFLLAALAVVSLFSVSCSSDEDLTANVEEERGVVKTEFTISFPQKVSGATRMSAENVQVPNATSNVVTFRGIQNIRLHPFSDITTSINGSHNLNSAITLVGGSNVYGVTSSSNASNTIEGGTASLLTTSKSRLYVDVDIPLGTKAFMFYGEAALPSNVSTNDPDVYGQLNYVSGEKLENVSFKLAQRNSDKTIGTNGTNIAKYLTKIAYAATTDATPKTWRESENVGLQYLYQNFIDIKNASWTNIKHAIQRLYTSMADKDTDNEVTKSIKSAVRTAIVSNIVTGQSVTQTDGTLNFPDMGDYPKDIHLPDGAAYVKWMDVKQSDNTTKKEFVPLAEAGESGINMASFDSYVYPSSLYYFGLSDIKTSKVSQLSAYTATNTWEQILAAYTDANATTSKVNNADVPSVTKDTRSIAIKDKVQYAVGRLDITVQAWDASNNNNKSTLGDNSTTASFDMTQNLFPITGILLSNQKSVNYKFETIPGESAQTIYDSAVPTGSDAIYLRSTESSALHTLALETEAPNTGTSDEDKADQKGVVKIVLEFQNNSEKDIVGYDNQLIYPGCKFYLVGTLDPRKTNNAITTINQAIKQDYTTTARLKIESLKYAYNVLPDLTMPKLEMGLSVDLTWQQGIDQNVIIE